MLFLQLPKGNASFGAMNQFQRTSWFEQCYCLICSWVNSLASVVYWLICVTGIKVMGKRRPQQFRFLEDVK
uniref:Uncharacterized protein n=1 Tax=Arundo donax TaxID=35708 RepID=A0A0A9FU57_ARUDO